jgi:hypothetical protein
VAQLFFGVRDQVEGQLEVLLELLVRVHVVARHAEHHGAGLDEVLVPVTELHGLGGATRRRVLRIEIEYNRTAHIGLRGELHAAGRDGFEFREGFVDGWGHVFRLSKTGPVMA